MDLKIHSEISESKIENSIFVRVKDDMGCNMQWP